MRDAGGRGGGFGDEQEGQEFGEVEDSGFHREVEIGDVALASRHRHEEACDGDEESLCDDLLLDAVRGTRMKLSRVEVGGFLQFVELFDLPAQVIQLGNLAS